MLGMNKVINDGRSNLYGGGSQPSLLLTLTHSLSLSLLTDSLRREPSRCPSPPLRAIRLPPENTRISQIPGKLCQQLWFHGGESPNPNCTPSPKFNAHPPKSRPKPQNQCPKPKIKTQTPSVTSHQRDVCCCPLSSELGTDKTVKVRFWPWLAPLWSDSGPGLRHYFG